MLTVRPIDVIPAVLSSNHILDLFSLEFLFEEVGLVQVHLVRASTALEAVGW